MTYTLYCIAGGFLAGWVARSQLEKRLRGGNLGRDPLVMNEGRKPAPPAGPPIYGWGPHQLNPPPPAPGMRREWLWSPTQMAECGGPCWESLDPKACVCGQLWRDVPIRMDEGSTQRGNGSGGPATPKPNIVPKPQFPAGRVIDAWGCTVGYIPRSQGGTPNPPPREP